MVKKTATPNGSTTTVEAPKPKLPKPKALEVNSPLVSSEVNATVATSRMKGSYLKFDPRMDEDHPITVTFRTRETPGPVFKDIVYPSPEPGEGKTEIPLPYMTKAMEYTLVISYTGTVNGQAATSLEKEVLMEFYPASEGKELAPYFLKEKIFQNTPTLDMHDFKGDGIVKTKVPYLAQVGDKFYCTLVTQQFSGDPVFYTVAYGYELTVEDIESGELTHAVSRGWLARQIPLYEAMTLQCGYITSGLAAQPPADVTNPDEKTLLPRNALQIQYRRTTAFIGDQRLDLLPAHLRQSAFFNNEWCLNPELTKQGGNVDTPGLDTYADDQVCFYVSGPGYGSKPLGCVTIQNDGDLATIELSPCVIACFFNKPMTLTYTVQFPNNNEPQRSPERVVNVLLPQFPHAEIEQATGNIVDLNTFSTDATAFVSVGDYAECAKCCWMWITGEREDGSTYRFDVLMDAPVNDDWKANGVDSPILRAELQKLADCSEFKLHFAVSFCDKCDLASAHEFPAQTFKIEQEPLALIKPAVREAVVDQLTAYNGRNGVHVEVDYVGNNLKHSISVCWKRPNGSYWPLAPKPGSPTGAVVWMLPPEAVIESMGKVVEIIYTVTTACKVQTSPPLNLNVSLPVRLEAPNVLEATPPRTQNAVLDLRTFTGNANSLEDTMWFLQAGQKCWLRADGTDKNGNAYSFNVYSARTITAAEETAGVAGPVLRSELDKLMDKTNLTLTFSVATDGSSTANVVCPPRDLTVLAPLYDLSPFTGGNWNGWGPGAAAYRPVDLLMMNLGGNWVLVHDASDTRAGELMKKRYDGLNIGRTYEFSIRVKNRNGYLPVPTLSLQATDGLTVIRVTAPTQFYAQAFVELKGTFQATASTMWLSVITYQSVPPGGDGDDYELDDALVRSI
ncbi:hypothetical protein [Pseudomonas extremorientalis]|jgi:hypothetical protein|uniref:Uncharacterized protein n=1 Tax=Pseudomonas extremorientalis TaxID=169669 RepID=A0A1H0N408_9PSED|nr:hypothetical protein [Pseudomonas extremorientalis]KAB0516444.1 hypothetical protein F7R08_22590 [Pseudomonas extremorientalis]OIN07232.1 hypothetical protein BFN10_17910 [Pseudomonas extremorientalis]SDO87110.1 hypothetical protein SAMN04490184_1667 [Pseudomonas extremorientalis]